MFIGSNSRCPICKARRARGLVSTTVIDRERRYGLITRTAHTYGAAYYHPYGAGRPAGPHGGSTTIGSRTQWQDRVPVIRTTFRDEYVCRIRGCRWTESTVEEQEDFGRE
jgi:hypothetical protein